MKKDAALAALRRDLAKADAVVWGTIGFVTLGLLGSVYLVAPSREASSTEASAQAPRSHAVVAEEGRPWPLAENVKRATVPAVISSGVDSSDATLYLGDGAQTVMVVACPSERTNDTGSVFMTSSVPDRVFRRMQHVGAIGDTVNAGQLAPPELSAAFRSVCAETAVDKRLEAAAVLRDILVTYEPLLSFRQGYYKAEYVPR